MANSIITSIGFRKTLVTSTIHASPTAHLFAQGSLDFGRASTDSDSDVEDAGISAGVMLSKFAKDASEALSEVPYVKGIFGIIAQLLEIQEVRTV